jgi:cytidylate kinase
MTKIQKRIESNVNSWFKQLDESASLKHMPRENKPYVTISRDSGAYGITVAQMLSESLSKHDRRKDAVWPVFDKELIGKVITEHKFPEKYERYLNESAMPAIQDIMEDMLGVHPPHETLIRQMSETIYYLARIGYVIIVGRGGNIITQSIPNGVHVRLVGSLENRVAHMREVLDIGEKAAREYVIKEDRNRHDYIKKYFHKDIDDVSLYDLVINSDTVPLEDIVRIIGDMVFKGKEKTQSVD